MSRSRFLRVVLLLMVLVLTLPLVVQSEIVGHLTQVEGRVDLMKGGKLPAIPVKLQDGVESKDVLRTKSLSKAQITFIDNSSVTVSPESRIAIEEYLFNPAQQKRTAVLKIFQGLAHVVVTQLFKVEEPDFVVKTHTAITGVRGTDFGVRIHPNSSTILNFKGLTQVANIFPEVGRLFRRAFMVAYSFGRPDSPNSVLLKDMQGTTVGRGMPPTLPFAVTPQDQQQFMNQMGSGLISRKSNPRSAGGTASSSGSGSAGTESGGTGAGGAATDTATVSVVSSSVENLGGPGSGLGTTVPAIAPIGLVTGTGSAGVTQVDTVTVPPVNTPTPETLTIAAEPPAPTPETIIPTIPTTPTDTTTPTTPTTDATTPTTPTTPTYAFTQTSQSAWTSSTISSTTYTVASTGWGMRTGIAVEGTEPLPESYAGYFTSSGTGTRTVLLGDSFAGSSTGVSTSTMTGTVTGVLGSTLTGTATVTGINSFGHSHSWTGTITIEPSGKMTFVYEGTVISTQRLAEAAGTTTSIPGTYFTQILSGVMSQTSASPFSSQSTTTTWAGASSSGLPSMYYSVNVTGGTTTPWRYSFTPHQYSALEGILAGVISRTESGVLQGAASITPAGRDTPLASSLSMPPSPYLFGRGANDNTPIVSTVNIDPATGVLSGSVFTTNYQSRRYTSEVYSLTQTPQASPVTPPASATYAFEQTYHGASWINYGLSGPGSILQTQGNGWGLTLGVSSPSWAPGALALPSPYSGTITGNTGWFTAYDQGTWNVTSGVWPSSFSSGYNAAVGVTQMRGTVTGVPGQTLTGTNMTFIGSLLNGFSFSYSGPVTIEPDGDTKFTYTGTWAKAGTTDAASGTASGTMGQYPGYHFVQSTSSDYSLTSVTDSSGKRYTGTVAIPFSNWTGNVAGTTATVNSLAGNVSLYSPDGTLPASGPGTSDVTLEGVVSYSHNGALFGLANLSLGSPLNMSIPGYTVLTTGGAIFNTGGVFVQPSGTSPASVVNVQPATLSQALYSFAQTYQGFRLGTGSTPFTVANVEGYGWGTITGTGASPLPTSYTGGSPTGYFVSQDLGTRASLTAMTPGYSSITGSMTGTLSGVSGQTLAGQMTFTGTNSLGTSLNYQGTATLATDGTLIWNYYGTWTSGSNSGTGSGTWTQVLGTYFEETINSGTFVQAASSTTAVGTTYSSATVQDSAPLAGTRRVGAGSPTSTTGSFAGIRTSTVNTFPSASGATPNVTMKGVVAGSDWQTKWGVATIKGTGSPAGSAGISGPVTLDPAGKLTGQFVDVVRNSPGQPADNVTINLVTVPAGTGQTTSSFVQTVSGNVTQTPLGTTPATQATLITPTSTPLTGTSTGLMSGNINAIVNLTSTAVTPVYVTAGTGPMSAQIVGAVGGPAGGPQTGVASMHSVKTVGGHTLQRMHLGTATHKPATPSTPTTPSTPATLTTNLQGLNNPPSGVAAAQKGTVTVTPK